MTAFASESESFSSSDSLYSVVVLPSSVDASCRSLALSFASAFASARVVGPTKKADVEALRLTHKCECGETWGTQWGLDAHRRFGRLANEVFEQDDDGDDDHDVEALLNTRGLPSERRWRVKWVGKNADGSDRWMAHGWIEEKHLSKSDEMIAVRQEYWRNNMHQSQRKVNDLT
jgi:hypothetical protein